MLQVEVRPPSPYRLGRGSDDRTLRVDRGVAARLLHVEGSPVLVRAWQPAADRVLVRAEPVDPATVHRPLAVPDDEPAPATRPQLEIAVERIRFALGVDVDLGDFHRRFRRDPLIGPLL